MSVSFQQLGVSTPVATALARQGITDPFAIQTLVLPDALAGLDILAESPTGSGKTLAFGVPLLERTAGANARPAALVLVPTRELAIQVADDLTPLAAARGLKVATVYGGASIGPQIDKARRAHVLVATPGRLFDLIERRAVKLDAVRVLVLDEADRMLDMGFKPQVDRILKGVPQNRQTMLFSATFDGAVAELARAYTRSSPSRPMASSTASSSSSATSAAGRSCSCGRSTAPTSSCASSTASTGSGRSRCTATSRRTSASARSGSSRRAASRRLSRPTSPPAASTSTTSRT
jgi:superfamily II DNA/RNA helicase